MNRPLSVTYDPNKDEVDLNLNESALKPNTTSKTLTEIRSSTDDDNLSIEIENIEKNILQIVKTPLKRFYVNINHDRHKLWTISGNIESNEVPIVMLHGFCGGLALWIQNIDALAGTHPFYAFDLLGFGRSSRPEFSEDPAEAESQFVESIEQWRREMNLEQIILFGHSFGGYLACAYALKYPIYLKALILIDPWGFSMKPQPDQKDHVRALWLKAVGKIPKNINPIDMFRASGQVGITVFKLARPNYKQHYMNILDDTDLIYHYIYHANNARPTGELAFRNMSEGFYYAKRPMLSRFADLADYLSVWIIHGSRSFIDSIPFYQALKQREKNTAIKEIQDADHHVYASKPDEFNEYVKTIIMSISYESTTKTYSLIN